jgi:hypothetical protein
MVCLLERITDSPKNEDMPVIMQIYEITLFHGISLLILVSHDEVTATMAEARKHTATMSTTKTDNPKRDKFAKPSLAHQ